MSRRREQQARDAREVLSPQTRAHAELEREILARILSPAVSSTTAGWEIPAFGLYSPPTLEEPLGHAEYTFQHQIAGPQRRSWDWITQHSTLFYQTDNDVFYLRMKSSDCGITSAEWHRLFPDARRVAANFRTFELVDVSRMRNLSIHANQRLPDVAYYEVDLASRAPQHRIAIDFDELSELEDFVNPVLDLVQERMELLRNPLMDPPPIALLTHFIASAFLNQFSADAVIRRVNELAIVLTFETRSSIESEIIMLDDSIQMNVDIYRQMNNAILEFVRDLSLRILQLIWQIRSTIMVDHYEENGAFMFHPRSVRFVMKEPHHLRAEFDNDLAPNHFFDPSGEIYTKAPAWLKLPRGGCLSVTGMPSGLSKLLATRVVSHDIYRPGQFFDNNCGLRESLICIGAAPKTNGDVSAIYKVAAGLRAQTPTIPPHVKLSPFQILNILIFQAGDIPFIFNVCRLPSSKHPEGESWTYASESVAIAPEAERSYIYLVYSHGHYFGMAARDPVEKEADYQWIQKLRYCNRCNKYYHPELGGRVSHIGQNPSINYPDCSQRHKKDAKNSALKVIDALVVNRKENDAEAHRLSSCSPTPTYLVTPLDRVGLMDLETYRPEHKNNYHECYGMGWIKAASRNIKTTDVLVYRSLDDLTTDSAALVHAFVDVIAYVLSEPEKFSKKHPYYVYFYNGSNFDNLFIFNILATAHKMIPSDFTMKEGKLLTISYLDGALVIHDLILMVLCSLDKACKTFKVEDHLAKGKLDHEKMVSMEAIEQHWGEIETYLRRDLTALNMVFIEFQELSLKLFHLDPCPRITMSHLSYDFWKCNLTENMRQQIILPRTFDEYTDILKSYYGGRVFPQIKQWTTSHNMFDEQGNFSMNYDDIEDSFEPLDVCSLYPSAMRSSPVISAKYFRKNGYEAARNVPKYFCGKPQHMTVGPQFYAIRQLLMEQCVRDPEKKHHPKDHWIHISKMHNNCFKLEHHGALVQVDWHIDPSQMPGFPVLPHKDEKGNTAWDFLPRRNQWYVLDEILDAKSYGYQVTALHQLYYYPKRLALFDTTMDILIAGKASCEKDSAGYVMYKLAANGIYGKHAQKVITSGMKLIFPSELATIVDEKSILSIEPVCLVTNAHQLEKVNKVHVMNNHPDNIEAFMDFIDSETDREPQNQVMMDVDVDTSRVGPGGLFREVLEGRMITVRAFLVKFKEEKLKFTKPTHLGCQVTAYSRMHMNWLADVLGLGQASNDIRRQIAYTDTDSLVCHRSAMMRFPGVIGDQLGMLSNELKGGKIIDIVCLAPKTYCLTFVLPDNKRYLKIRCKGFPHPKADMEYNDQPLDPTSPKYANMFSHDPISGLYHLIPENIPLGVQIYSFTFADLASLYFPHLNPRIFRLILEAENKSKYTLTVHFTSMRKNYFGKNTLGEISGICHTFVTRSLKMATWWRDEEGIEKHRIPHPTEPNLTVPIGFTLPPLDDTFGAQIN